MSQLAMPSLSLSLSLSPSLSLRITDQLTFWNRYRVYTIPGEQYQVPTAFVWIFTARLVTGKGLPPMAREWALGSAMLFAALTALRIRLHPNSRWQRLIPGGIAVAVGTFYPGWMKSFAPGP
jgi:uncharacterized oligopeptide transporter (OPT) family protein